MKYFKLKILLNMYDVFTHIYKTKVKTQFIEYVKHVLIGSNY
jgi:hypothetical protein